MEYKVPFVGNPSVGKTSIIARYAQNKFSEETLPTVGASNFNFSVQVDGKEVIMNIWDTAGQERFRSLVPLYTRGANLVVIVFDISDADSFASLDDWYQKLRGDFCLKCPIFLCANKIDLEPIVEIKNVKAWAQDHQVQCFFTSAAANREVSELFLTIAQTVCTQEQQNFDTKPNKLNEAKKDEKSGCC